MISCEVNLITDDGSGKRNSAYAPENSPWNGDPSAYQSNDTKGYFAPERNEAQNINQPPAPEQAQSNKKRWMIFAIAIFAIVALALALGLGLGIGLSRSKQS
jgi:hypothetical protein